MRERLHWTDAAPSPELERAARSRDPSERLAREVAALGARIGVLARDRRWLQPTDHLVEILTDEFTSVTGDPDLSAWDGGILDRPPPAGTRHPINRLVDALGLLSVEADLLVLAGMPEQGLQYTQALRGLHPQAEPRPTVWLAGELFCSNRLERLYLRHLLEDGPAVRAGALRLTEGSALPERGLVVADGLWSVLNGLDLWPGALAPLDGPVVLAGLDAWFAEVEVVRVLEALAAAERLIVMVTADSEDAALQRGAALAARAGVRFARLSWSSAASEGLITAHTAARDLVPVLRMAATDAALDAPRLESLAGPVILCGRAGAVRVRGSRPVVVLPVTPLGPSARAGMWGALLPDVSETAALAARYAVEPSLAAEVAGDARAAAHREQRSVTLTDVAAGIRARSGAALATGVKLVRPTARWDQLVLRPEHFAPLREAADRLLGQARVLDEWRFLHGRPGARGVRMLLCGPSGTGKSLSAEVLACELGLDLLVVDISRVVSKWIGETEKNLAQVFDIAESANAVLLFDEADALFGKRTEVSDAHDCYANLETAYLLSRLERFEGLAVLTTNLRQNIDQAFVRRLEFIVAYEEPGLSERVALWRAHLPASAPLAADVDCRELAALFPVVGGLIRNAAVGAAFLAAAEGASIRRSHLIHAMRREYDKSGRAFPEAEAKP